MALVYRVAPLPEPWPGERTARRKVSPFKVNWTSTLRLLDTELRALRAQEIVLRLAVTPEHIRADGGVRGSARISDPSVVLEFKSGADRLSFPCDRFNWWEDNVRAIALALEALRKVDRYGVRSGRQYEGFKALPGTAASHPEMHTTTDAAMYVQQAADGEYSPGVVAGMLAIASVAQERIRRAAAVLHPDRESGSVEAFQQLQDARRMLSQHHGVTL